MLFPSFSPVVGFSLDLVDLPVLTPKSIKVSIKICEGRFMAMARLIGYYYVVWDFSAFSFSVPPLACGLRLCCELVSFALRDFRSLVLIGFAFSSCNTCSFSNRWEIGSPPFIIFPSLSHFLPNLFIYHFTGLNVKWKLGGPRFSRLL